VKKKILANLQRIIELFIQKIVIKLSKILVGIQNLGLEIWDPGSEKTYLDPRSRVHKGTGPATLRLDYADILLPSTCGSKDRNMEKISSFLWWVEKEILNTRKKKNQMIKYFIFILAGWKGYRSRSESAWGRTSWSIFLVFTSCMSL